jgi:hypothetical protein
MSTKKNKPELPTSEEFSNFVNLVAVYADASNQLEALQNDANNELLLWLDERKGDYARLQGTLAQAETALELIALKHPDWFGEKKSIKTPFGTAKLHSSTKLVVKNEETTLLLMDRESEKNKEFKKADYIRTKQELNLEALEQLDVETLTRLRIDRVTTDNFSVAPAKVDLGKAFKETATKE